MNIETVHPAFFWKAQHFLILQQTSLNSTSEDLIVAMFSPSINMNECCFVKHRCSGNNKKTKDMYVKLNKTWFLNFPVTSLLLREFTSISKLTVVL